MSIRKTLQSLPSSAFLVIIFIFSSSAFAQSGEQLLKGLTGWDIPGLENVKVKGVKVGKNYFSADLPAVAGGKIKPKVVGFKTDNQHKYTVGIILDKFYLSDFASALKNTPLNDLAFQNLTLLSVPKENANHATAIPNALRKDLGNSPIKKPAGTSLAGKTKLVGLAQNFVTKLGISSRSLDLSGSIDPGLFAGKISGSQLKQAFLDRLDISLPLPSLRPHWRPGFMKFQESALRVKGSGTSIALTVETGIDLDVGNTLKFAPVLATYDNAKKKLSISGALVKGSPTLPVPLSNSSVSGLKFYAEIDKGQPRFSVTGRLKLNNKNHDFSADISGQSKATFALSLDGKFALSDFGTGTVPGLENVLVSNPTISNTYTSGHISIGKIKPTLVVFKSAGKIKPNVALLHNTLKLSEYVAAVKGTPLDDLRLQKPAFILTPKENAGVNKGLPEILSNHIGTSELSLKPGVNIKAVTEVVGQVGKFMSAFDVPAKNLPLTGIFDPSVFKQPKNLTKAFIAQLDLNIAIKKLKIPGAPKFLTLSKSALRVKGYPDGLGVKFASNAAVKIAGKTFKFDDTLIGITEHNGGKTYELAGTSTKNWKSPLGVPWLTLKNIGLDVKLGAEKSLSLSGVTSLGKIHNLTASLDLNVAGGAVGDIGIGLTGANIPLNAIPGLQLIPNTKDFALRDLIVSKREIAGTTVTKKLKALNGLRAVIFQVGTRWNFVMLRKNLSLTDVVPVVGVAKTILQKIKLDEAAIVLSSAGLNNPLSDLPKSARAAMEKIYGNNPTGRLHLTDGLNMVTAIDPKHFGKGLSALSGSSGKPIAFSGGIGGLFGGPPSIDIAADLPRIKMPQSLHFLKLPKELQTSFFIRLEEQTADLGIELATLLEVKTKHQKVKFDTTIDFEVDTSGGLAIDVQGRTDSIWKNALGIKGFALDPGTRMEIKASASSEVDVTFVGKSHIGDREVDVTASVGVIGGETIDKGAFEGYTSELGLHDLIALTNSVATATGGKPTDSKKVSNIKLTGVDFAFASPGVDVPEMKLVGGGMRLAGDLWFMIKKKPLGKFMAQIDATGLVINGKLSDFKVGAIVLKDTSLDVAATIMPPAPPYFKIKGNADLFNANLGAEYSAALNAISFRTFLKDPPLLVIDIAAHVGTEKLSFTPNELAKFDMSLRAELKSDLPKWLRTDGKKVVSKAFNSVSGEIKKLETDLDAAKSKVATLDGQIKKARAQVRKGKNATDDALVAAEAKVKSAKNSVATLNRDIKNLKSKIHTCKQTKKICVWYDVIKRKCTKHKRVPNLGKIAKCEANNTKYGTRLVAKQTALTTAQASLSAANLVLDGLRKGNKMDTTDLDPRVAPLIVARDSATEALNLAKAAAAGAANATQKMKAALDRFAQANVFVLKEGLIQGSLSGMIKGTPVVIGMNFEILGKSYHNAFAFSATDPAFTAEQMGTIAMYMALKIVDSAHGKDPATATLLRLLRESYNTMHDASEKKLNVAMKANGL